MSYDRAPNSLLVIVGFAGHSPLPMQDRSVSVFPCRILTIPAKTIRVLRVPSHCPGYLQPSVVRPEMRNICRSPFHRWDGDSCRLVG